MGTPTLEQLVRAVERLAALALGTGAAPSDPDRLLTDCLRIGYRLVFADLAVRRGGVLSFGDAVATMQLEVIDPGLLDEAVVSELAAMLAPDATGAATGAAAGSADASGAEPVAALGALHESVLMHRPVTTDGRLRLTPTGDAGGSARKAAGSYFTPAALVDWLLDHALEPALDETPHAELTVLDPACGAGIFLVAATRRLRLRGSSSACAIEQVAGVDRDPAALEIARTCLWLEAVEPGHPVAMPALALRVGDTLRDLDGRGRSPDGVDGVDVVVGNPPFLNQLERLTAHSPGRAAELNARSHGLLRPYTDVSAIFLQRSVDWVRPGGRIGLVQPQSLLAARDAAGVRAHVASTCALEAIWASDVPVFNAHVLTCAPVVRRGAAQGTVRRFHGPSFTEVEPRVHPDLGGGWGYLLAAGLGIPEVDLPRAPGVLADIADCTADFRDQYYGLAPYVAEQDGDVGEHLAPLVTSGLIDPAVNLWGQRPTRFLKRLWAAPVIDLEALRDDPKLHRWATRRLVPKVLVGTQGRVIEAVVDESGRWLPSVPTVTVVPAKSQLWHVLAVLLAPPVAAHAAATYAGTALSMRAIKLSAGQVGQLPLPSDGAAWELAARAVRQAQQEPDGRHELLAEAAGHMCRAYGTGDDVLQWWLSRLPRVQHHRVQHHRGGPLPERRRAEEL